MLKPTHIRVNIDFNIITGFHEVNLLEDALIIGARDKDSLTKELENCINMSTLDTSNFPSLYIDKSCKIPRAKLSTLKEDKVLEVKRNVEKAEYFVIHKNDFVNSLIEHIYYGHTIYLEELYKWIKFDLDHRDSYSEEEIAKIRSNFTAIVEVCKANSTNKLAVYLDYNSQRFLYNLKDSKNRDYRYYLKLKDDVKYSKEPINFLINPSRKVDEDLNVSREAIHVYISLKNERFEKLEYALDNNLKIINSTDVTKLLNITIIDEELFDSLNNMLKSDDSSNWDTALEIISSCDYEESLVYIVLLLNLNYNNVSYSRYFTHVNFQSVIQFISSKINKTQISTPYRFRRNMGGSLEVERDLFSLLEEGYLLPKHKNLVIAYVFPHHKVNSEFIGADFRIADSVLRKMNLNEENKENEL